MLNSCFSCKLGALENCHVLGSETLEHSDLVLNFSVWEKNVATVEKLYIIIAQQEKIGGRNDR
jgi:hypothetical protein